MRREQGSQLVKFVEHNLDRGGIDKNLRKIICPKINFEVWKL
jgi:hypothetical protein